ncbi:uncharacterized protein UBRO_20148 [Ustilago bromivora]|uniref:Uncharacterized protein n=1 Tax=Ustilago bromivora TaxID=307758 RepID=A0A1K0GW82_9BASI|nr:uncharacterized protein UBRO_20148 [Ustilago bromivora]
MCTPSRRCSSSPPLSGTSPLPACMDHDPGSSITASLVLALEAWFSCLKQQLDSQLVLTSSSQALLPPRSQAPPAAVLALPSAGQTSGTSGELPSLPLTCCFAWVPLDIIQQVKCNQLKPEHLVKLCNPESRVSKEPSQLTHLAVGPGGILVGAEESSDTCTSTFIKTIPTITTLAQIWLVYITIRVCATGNLTLNEALLTCLEHLIECDHLYQWRAITDYHLAVCRQWFGTGTIQEWSSYDPQLSSWVFYPHLKTSTFSSHGLIPPLPRPNTLCKHTIFDATDTPATLGMLQLCLWSTFLDLYPNQAFASQLRGALQHGVKLGYDTCLDVVNLPMDSDDVHHLHHEMEARLAEGHLCHVTDPISMCLVCSLVSVVPKPHSNKRRTIYHLSHPHKPGTHLLSINDGINTSFVTIRYESLDAIMDFIYARLMGIHFDAFTLQAVSPLLTSHSDMSHYVNNFFGASDTTASPATPIQVLSLSAAALGFKLSHKKAVWDTTKLEILGVELDSVTQTASITQQ